MSSRAHPLGEHPDIAKAGQRPALGLRVRPAGGGNRRPERIPGHHHNRFGRYLSLPRCRACFHCAPVPDRIRNGAAIRLGAPRSTTNVHTQRTPRG